MATIEDRIRKLVTEQLQVKPEKVLTETKFEALGADSLDLVELVIALEQEFELDIPDEEAATLLSFGVAVDYVRKNLPDSVDA